MAAGIFIAFEGVDGAGKSTQLARAAARLSALGRKVVATREPGGTPGAEEIRRLLVSGDTGRWSAETELLLFNAARRDHVERVIRPALAAGAVVLTDRFVDSTRAYQTAGRGADRALVEAAHGLFIGLEPDLCLIFDLDADAAAARGKPGAEDRYERFGPDFQARLRGAFRGLAAEEPSRRRLINAAAELDAVEAAVWREIAPLAAPA